MNIIDIIVFLIFTVGTIVFGYLFGRKTRAATSLLVETGKCLAGLSDSPSLLRSVVPYHFLDTAHQPLWVIGMHSYSHSPSFQPDCWQCGILCHFTVRSEASVPTAILKNGSEDGHGFTPRCSIFSHRYAGPEQSCFCLRCQ